MVAFSDFLLADILTSLSKPLSDLGLVACRFASSRSLATQLIGDSNKAQQEGALQCPKCTAGHDSMRGAQSCVNESFLQRKQNHFMIFGGFNLHLGALTLLPHACHATNS